MSEDLLGVAPRGRSREALEDVKERLGSYGGTTVPRILNRSVISDVLISDRKGINHADLSDGRGPRSKQKFV